MGRTLRAGEHHGAMRGQGVFRRPPARSPGDVGQREVRKPASVGAAGGETEQQRQEGAWLGQEKSSFQKAGGAQVSLCCHDQQEEGEGTLLGASMTVVLVKDGGDNGRVGGEGAGGTGTRPEHQGPGPLGGEV